MSCKLVVVALLLAACTAEEPGGDATGPDAGPGETSCDRPALAPSWLGEDLREIVAVLAGEQALPGGGTLADRATPERRALARDYLLGALATRGLPVEAQDYPGGVNLVVRLAPTVDEPEPDIVVFGAHYDSVDGSPGANDNASGVAAAVAAARFLATVPCRRREARIALFDEEESGLVGSRAMAQALVAEGVGVRAVHTIDQMGWDADGDRAVELERADPGLAALYRSVIADEGLGIPVVETDTGNTDHVAFREVGFAAIGITEEFVSGDTTPHYHGPGDTFDTVNLEYLASTTALIHGVLAGEVTADGSLATETRR